jgi:hypothetical protein
MNSVELMSFSDVNATKLCGIEATSQDKLITVNTLVVSANGVAMIGNGIPYQPTAIRPAPTGRRSASSTL